MKLVHIISSCTTGGAEIFTKSLVTSLIELDKVKEIELWVMYNIIDLFPEDQNKIEFEKKFIKDLNQKGISVKFINKRPKKDWTKTKKKIRDLYNSFKPDIIHSHLEAVTFHTCRSLSKYNVPIIQTVHSTVINHPIIQKYYINKKINAFVAISKVVNDNIYKRLNVSSRKIYLIYNGVQIDKFKNKNRLYNKEVKKIIAIGRLTEAKDYGNLLRSMKILNDQLSEFNKSMPKLLIVGDGELKEQIKELSISLKIENNVEFLGIRQDIAELLAESDVYVMSSEWEGLSISLIEALTSGIPIIATNAGSNNEIIEDGVNGLLVPIKDSEALAHGLYKLISNYEYRLSFANNSVFNIEKFGIEKCSLEHFSMYNKILKGV